MPGYATNTKVSVASSKAEIETILNRFGIQDYGVSTFGGRSAVGFQYKGQMYRIEVVLPDQNSEEFMMTPSRGTRRSADTAYAAWEQACRVRWRELVLLIKAKVVAITSGVVSLEDEFLAYAVLPSGQTVGSLTQSQLQGFAERGEIPPMMLMARNP